MMDAVARFAGIAKLYDQVRPSPPIDMVELLTDWVETDHPSVVDLGAGTGLSAEVWSGRARQVTAIEPGADMRELAVARLGALPDAANFTVLDGTADDTGLPDGQTDVVTACQALHWFEPSTTFPEIARILRPGGVFASFDCVWPPTVHPAVDVAYLGYQRRSERIAVKRGSGPRYFPMGGHAKRLRECGLFDFVTELALHKREHGDAERLVALALSQSGIAKLLRSGASEDELGLTRLREVCAEHMSARTSFWWTYEVRLAVVRERRAEPDIY